MRTFLRCASGMATIYMALIPATVYLCQTPAFANPDGLQTLAGIASDPDKKHEPGNYSQPAKVNVNDNPLQVIISLDEQSLQVYKGLRKIASSKISSGKKGHETPRGIFSILEKRKYHESNLYSNAPMPHMQRLTWSGIALHEGHVPDRPASHGCLRMPPKFAKSLYRKTGYGDHVIIAPERVFPRAVDHPSLFQPSLELQASFKLRPTANSAQFADYKIAYRAGTATSDAPLRIYITRKTINEILRDAQRLLADANLYAGKIDGILGRKTIAALKQFQANSGLPETGRLDEQTKKAIFTNNSNHATGSAHLYVRQNHLPLFDAPVTLKSPKQPLGSHLLVTHDFTLTRTGWMGTTVSTQIPQSIIAAHRLDDSAKRRFRGSISDALDRIVIPKALRERIEARLTPGSSIAISDNGIGTETGKGTDFIVQTR